MVLLVAEIMLIRLTTTKDYSVDFILLKHSHWIMALSV